jgi:hypothetical protein
LSPARAPRRGTLALVAPLSVFIANLLLTHDQVLNRANKFQIDGLLQEPFSQDVTRVGSQPFARLRRVGNVHLDQCQQVSFNNALIPPEPPRRVMAEDEERAAAEAAGEFVCRVQKRPSSTDARWPAASGLWKTGSRRSTVIQALVPLLIATLPAPSARLFGGLS